MWTLRADPNDHHDTSDPTVLVWIIQPPPRSTLFPYTTLFRSQENRAVVNWRKFQALPGRSPDGTGKGLLRDAARCGDQRDRKSTRLNSSHTVISYAVFCLKKKIKLNKNSASEPDRALLHTSSS